LRNYGFTLIELSIVLVIIGLIVGGVLVGRDLIAASAVRSQVSQITRFTQAAHTFRSKYGFLPGDIQEPQATSFGFLARGAYAGEGDGNGLLEGISSHAAAQNYGVRMNAGETSTFWVDLSTARLVEGRFTSARPTSATTLNTVAGFRTFYPEASIGGGNFIYAWSGGYNSGQSGTGTGDGINYLGISIPTFCSVATFSSSLGLTVGQASAIDAKMDDGLPQGGRVTALYLNWDSFRTPNYAGALAGVATPGSATTCYDNNNAATEPHKYSVTQNNGTGINCALSFAF